MQRQSKLRAQQKCSLALLNMTLRDSMAGAFLGEYQLLAPLLELAQSSSSTSSSSSHNQHDASSSRGNSRGSSKGSGASHGDVGVLRNCAAALVNLLSERDCKVKYCYLLYVLFAYMHVLLCMHGYVYGVLSLSSAYSVKTAFVSACSAFLL
jgi:hypothetical protein